jgi:hypothetical protein
MTRGFRCSPRNLPDPFRSGVAERREAEPMTPRELEEYRSLRATIRERGTTRVWVFVVGLTVWAALTLATAALAALPIATALPLLLLAAVFEAVYALHTGVERIGRYLQVFYEHEPGERHWERTVMAFGQTAPPGGSDPLFGRYFWMATVTNVVPAALTEPKVEEWIAVGVFHVIFLVRIALAQRHAAGQRAADLQRFERLKGDGTGTQSAAASAAGSSRKSSAES